MKLIVGLGNPGKQYEKTRHNTGFMILDAYAKKHQVSFETSKFHGKLSEFLFHGEKVFLLKPESYMNLSGEVVSEVVNFYKIAIEDILIISDDLDQEVGKVRLRAHGSSGGHNGLKNIELHLHTDGYKRMRVGIGKSSFLSAPDYVLGKFSKEELDQFEKNMDRYLSILDDFLCISFDQLMSRYNSNQ